MPAPLLVIAGKLAVDLAIGIATELAVQAGFEIIKEWREGDPIPPYNPSNWGQADFFNNSIQQLRQEKRIGRSYQKPLPTNSSYRPYPQTTITEPPKRLPTEVDNQTVTKTSIGASISVRKQQDANESYNRGVLKFNPLSTQYKQKLRKIPSKQLISNFTEAQKRGQKAQENKLLEPQKIEQLGFLITTSDLAGFKGDGNFLYGLESISALSQAIKAMNSISLITPTNEIATQNDEQLIDDDYKKLDFKGFAERVEDDKLKQLLGIDFIEELTKNDFTIESLIKNIGKESYNDTSNPTKLPKESIDNLAEFFINLIASLFFRSGFHRFPAKIPEYLNQNQPKNINLEDMLEVQEWIVKNIDNILGEFPLKFNNNGQDVIIPNIAEGLQEIILMVIDTVQNTDTSIAIGLKNLTETSKSSNAAIITQQIAKANAEYLGYKNKKSQLQVPYSFNPSGETLKQFLQDSTQKLITIENKDKDDINSLLKKILMACELFKVSTTKTETCQKNRNYDEDWTQLMQEYSIINTSSRIRKKFPNAKIRDLSKNN